MRLFKYVECESGVLHYVMAKNEIEAGKLALHHANLLRGTNEDEHIIPEELKFVKVEPSEVLTFCAHSKPIKHTRSEWELIYEVLEKPTYIACSEY